VLYLSPIVDNIQEGNFQRYSLTLGEVLAFPAELWLKNAEFIVGVAIAYLGWPLAIMAAATIALDLLWPGRDGRAIAVWSAASLVAFALTAKIIYSRYVVFCLVLALLPVAAWLVMIGRRSRASRAGRLVAIALGTTAALPGLLFAARLLADPAGAAWMDDRRYITDRFQYVESNYAGYGLPEIVGLLRERAAGSRIVVLTRNATGMARDGVAAYLLGWPNVEVGFVPENIAVDEGLQESATRAYEQISRGNPSYYVLTDAPGGEQERRFRSLNPGAQLVAEVAKPGNHSRFQLYQLSPATVEGDTWLDPPIRIGGALELRGYRLDSAVVRAGDTLRLTLYWAATGRAGKDYTVFNHVANPGGPIWGQKDSPPLGGRRPTSGWRPGDVVADHYEIPIKPETPPGVYELITGMYDFHTLQRLSVLRDVSDPSDRVLIASITVRPD
jgi:hypothetical protein